ncbi:MAG: hypothetical protein PHP75_08930, partial [Methylacidiphilaceae bacterium]|nr:hypothetical protein [Candidatus Methylacidiphilaceae bacterium]
MSYCPQGRGRMERFFGTWQGRLPREIQAAGIQTLEAANEHIRKKFLPWHNRTLAVKPKEEESVFVPAEGADLDGILCVQDDRIVGNDNTVHWGRKKLQILPQSWRIGLAKCRVRVCDASRRKPQRPVWSSGRRLVRLGGQAAGATPNQGGLRRAELCPCPGARA